MNFNKAILVPLLACFCLIVSCEDSTERAYYEDGVLKLEVPLKDGLRHGKMVEYSKDGKIQANANWKNGKLEGKSIVYYDNGNLSQENNFEAGKRCCQSKFFLLDGTLREVQKFDNSGRLIDYTKYLKSGKQDLDINTRQPIFITKSDTVHYGQVLDIMIRVGNRQYNSVEGILGDPNNKRILFGEKLPKKDSITIKISTKKYEIGENKLTGVLVDIDKEDRQQMVIIPFEYKFHVTM